MTKTELMETYTAEQLADIVIELESELKTARNLENEVLFEERIANNIRNATGMNIDDVRKAVQDTKKYMNDAYTEELKNQIEHMKSEVEKYRKSFEGAKKERDCQIAEYRKKIEELTNENEKLKGDAGSEGYQEKQEKTNNFYGMYKCAAKDLSKDNLLMFLGILTKELLKNGIDFRYEMDNEPKIWDITSKNDKMVADLLPTEPIKVAEMLINAEGEYKHNPLEKAFCGTDKGKYRIFDAAELRQIAEHLLIYCNHNKGEEE